MPALVENSRTPTLLAQGRYVLSDVIGHGGVGTVYRATDTVRGELVAIKVLMPHLVGTKVQRRFLREGEAMRALKHPNIVRVLDVGQDGGFVWMSMELMDRGTSHALARQRGSLPVSWCLHIADSVLAGLQQVHAADWVHRDLKPGNILLDKSGNVKLADFGILRDDNSDLTLPGSSLGTSAYMSPEQMDDPRCVTARSDLYSLGASLFALSTGKGPKNLAWLDGDPEDITSPWPLVPTPIRALVRRACAFNPDQRFRTAGAMRDAVREQLMEQQRSVA